MDLPVLIIKTGNTVGSLLNKGEDFEHWFCKGLGIEFDTRHENNSVVVRNVHEGENLPPSDSIGGVIITGSPAYLTDLAQWNFKVAEFIREAHSAGIPQLGVCYGHQLIAWAFGGEVGFNPGGREIGTVPIVLAPEAQSDELFSGLPEQLYAQASHQQSVLRLPENAVLLGANEFDANHCFRYGGSTWGIQFHPEFDRDITRAYINERSTDISAEGLNPDQLLSELRETPESASLLERFAEIIQRRRV